MKPIETHSNPVVTRMSLPTTPVSPTETTSRVRDEVAASVTPSPLATSAGKAPPVDSDRVALIRQAIEEGRYPVLPAKIADAMIAAGYLLRTKK